MILTKKLICRLVKPYIEEGMCICYAESQSLNSTSSKAILLVSDKTLIILFLNFFQTKVIHHIVYSRDEIENNRLNDGFSRADVVWRFTIKNKKWRFRIMKKIFTLGNLQKEFIKRL